MLNIERGMITVSNDGRISVWQWKKPNNMSGFKPRGGRSRGRGGHRGGYGGRGNYQGGQGRGAF